MSFGPSPSRLPFLAFGGRTSFLRLRGRRRNKRQEIVGDNLPLVIVTDPGPGVKPSCGIGHGFDFFTTSKSTLFRADCKAPVFFNTVSHCSLYGGYRILPAQPKETGRFPEFAPVEIVDAKVTPQAFPGFCRQSERSRNMSVVLLPTRMGTISTRPPLSSTTSRPTTSSGL